MQVCSLNEKMVQSPQKTITLCQNLSVSLIIGGERATGLSRAFCASEVRETSAVQYELLSDFNITILNI